VLIYLTILLVSIYFGYYILKYIVLFTVVILCYFKIKSLFIDKPLAENKQQRPIETGSKIESEATDLFN